MNDSWRARSRVELAVVIPTLDEEVTLGDCLASVGAHEGVEKIVVDGGSRDLTHDVAVAAGAKWVEGPRGRGTQLNLGADTTTAGRLLFLHADCRLPAGWLEAVQFALDDHAVALTCFRLRTVSSQSPSPSRLKRVSLRVFDLRSFGLGQPYGDQGFAVRRETFNRAGRFPEIPLMEDVAFARACRRLGTLHRLPLEVRTTARRFERRPVATALMLGVFPTLFRLGISPRRLARWYGIVR